jgi:erythromycin esterase-like protein
MGTADQPRTTAGIVRAAIPVSFTDNDYDSLLSAIGHARLVLIGEASHGTEEFYRERARITRHLIAEKGFCAVAVEADWPDAYRLNRYVLDLPSGDPASERDRNAVEALRGFQRFPAWMWRNTEVVAFAEWLREHNRKGHNCAGFYGLDLYSLYASAQAVLAYLDRTDPAAAARARFRYGCFEQFEEDTQAYGYAASFGLTESCEKAVLEQLNELQRKAGEVGSWDAPHARSEAFSAEQNARLVLDAERYYRAMFEQEESSWNLRDTHMADTLDELLRFLGPGAKVVVWAHNSHLGDTRATEMARRGELNLGQLVRERYGPASFNIGFTTFTGEVTAADSWDEPAQRKRVRPALESSYERLLHEAGSENGITNFLLISREDEQLQRLLRGPLLERAIGVIYRPETERQSHYFRAELTRQFDAVIHLDETNALVPLDTTTVWEPKQREPAETYPSGF